MIPDWETAKTTDEPTTRGAVILLADDDPDDRVLVREALDECGGSSADLRFVADGDELLDYLRRNGRYAGIAPAPTPALVLLDLNMPRRNGREALREIKSDPLLRHIPVVVLTTSRADQDISRSYDDGANSYIVKPVSFDGLVQAMHSLKTYWLHVVAGPPPT